MKRLAASTVAMLCFGLLGSGCIIEDEGYVFAVNLTDETILIFSVGLDGSETSSSGEVPPGSEWITGDGGNDCVPWTHRARNLDGDLVEERDSICRTDPWQINGIPDE